MMDHQGNAMGEFHGLRYHIPREDSTIPDLAYIRYGFIIFAFKSYPLLGSETIRKMTEETKVRNGGKLCFI